MFKVGVGYMKIFLARHGEVKHNVLKSFNSLDEDLTENGIEQSLKLKDDIKDFNIDLIISSPLKRTMHTANIVNKGLNILVDNRLRERECGNLSGLTFNKEDKKEYWNYYTSKKYGTEEDIKDFFDRIFKFLDELKEKNYSSVLIVTHSGVTRAFNAYFNGIGDGDFSSKGLKNCEFIEYEF